MSAGLTRRTFLKITVGAGAGLVLGCAYAPDRSSKTAGSKSQGGPFAPNVFVQVAVDGVVTVTVPRPECGTGVRTSLAMIVAEELGMDWKSVRIEQAKADDAYGDQGIGGSRSVATSFEPLRMAGATAALMLRQAAAAQWNVPVDKCRLDGGAVTDGGSRKLTLAELAEPASKLPVPDASMVKPKPKAEYKLVGKPTRQVDSESIVTGKAGFGLDVRVPGMLFACLARCPSFGGSPKSVDDSKARQVQGVKDVRTLATGIAVVADSTWAAFKGRDALNIEWDLGPNANVDTAELDRRFKEAEVEFPEITGAAKIIEATYKLPFLAHCPMEPMNCTASVTADTCEVWVPTQVPAAAKGEAIRVSGMQPDKVTVNMTLAGGGFGRRLAVDYVVEAVTLSKMIGAPVQVLWRREDELRHDYYRPMTHHAMRGAVDASGMPAAYHHQCFTAGGRRRQPNWGDARLEYDLPNAQMMRTSIDSPVPTGAWRSVDATFMCFASESFLDELAHAGGQDPLELRRKIMRNDKLRGTLELAVEKAGWGKPLPKGWGRGIACFNGFGSCCTQIAEVEVANGRVKVHRVVAAVDVGLVVNPLGVESQVQGATIDGVATLLYSAITIKNGGVEQTNFPDLGWARQSDAPKVEVYTVDSDAAPSGIGEPGYPASVPAIANAIFAACGKRVRSLPIGTDPGAWA